MKANEREGTLSMILTCECGWSGLVYYTTKRPVYCSNACKQRIYRERKRPKRNTRGVTYPTRQEVERELDQTLHLLVCDCGRGIWTVRGNVQIGGLHCELCDSAFKEV